MLKLPDGTIWLDQGEVVPMKCVACGHFYQPPAGSETSACPKCRVRNAHTDCGVQLTGFKAND